MEQTTIATAVAQPVNYVAAALTQEEQVKHAELKVKMTNDLPMSDAELSMYSNFNKKIAQARAAEERKPKLDAFVAASGELAGLGFKLSEIIGSIKGNFLTGAENAKKAEKAEIDNIVKLIKGVSATPKKEIVIAVFPEITVPNKSGELVPFEYKANKKYAGRGIDADAIKKIKAKGLDYFVKHLNDDGKTWYAEAVQGKRKVKATGQYPTFHPNQDYVAKMFAGAGSAPAAKKTTAKAK